MGVKVAATASVHWSHSISPLSPSSPQFSTSAISPLSTMKRSLSSEGSLVSRSIERVDRSSLFGSSSSSGTLYRSRSCPYLNSCVQPLRRSCSASLDASFEDDFVRKIQELALSSGDANDGVISGYAESDLRGRFMKKSVESGGQNCNDDLKRQSWKIMPELRVCQSQIPFPLGMEPPEPPWLEIHKRPFIQEDIERKANCVDLPMSLRIIKRKRQLQEGARESRESTYSSIEKVFSSMLFIIRELHSYTMHMREALLLEDLQGVIVRVQEEIHTSFAWLFQQVFSTTPTLMVYLMILLSNFTVQSMANNLAIFTTSSTYPSEIASIIDTQQLNSSISTAFNDGKSTSLGGTNSSGDGGNVRPPASRAHGDDHSSEEEAYMGFITESVSRQSAIMPLTEEEQELWNSLTEESSRLQSPTIQRLTVSPVTAIIPPDDGGRQKDYSKTKLLYEMRLAQEPDNPLLLANFAEFLCIVVHDYAKAEEYFKRAVAVGGEDKDGETWSKYARFLWNVKKDVWGAEEAYLEAISADPTNSYHAANYAHFLWNTGGEDTCYPL